MAKFYVTFPQKDAAREDKFAVIEAPDMHDARQRAFANFGMEWAFVYDAEEFRDQPTLYGLTELT